MCPRDLSKLVSDDDQLVCSQGHRYPVISGTPVLLLPDVPVTHHVCAESLSATRHAVYRETGPGKVANGVVDPFVQDIIVGTHGLMYRDLQGRLERYPIPEIPLAAGAGRSLLEVGCNWGRWCFAAARKGYRVVGLDPSLDAIMAARRVASQLRLHGVCFVVGDGRYLPFRDAAFDVVFSYSVLQHFSKDNAKVALRNICRVLAPSGESLVQMPNRYGLRNLYSRIKRRSSSGVFRVRHWRPAELLSAFEQAIGRSGLSIDGFFSLNPQEADSSLLPRRYRWVVKISTSLKRLGRRLPFLYRFADSLYVHSRKTGA